MRFFFYTIYPIICLVLGVIMIIQYYLDKKKDHEMRTELGLTVRELRNMGLFLASIGLFVLFYNNIFPPRLSSALTDAPSTATITSTTAPLADWAGETYTDPKGYFKITPPKAWNMQNYPSEPRGKIAFSTTEGNQLVEIRVLVQVTQVTDFQVFESKLKANAANLGIEPEWQVLNYSGMPAIKSIMTISNGGIATKYMNLRFLDGNIYHDIQFASPPVLFNKYQDLVSKVLATYEIVKRPD